MMEYLYNYGYKFQFKEEITKEDDNSTEKTDVKDIEAVLYQCFDYDPMLAQTAMFFGNNAPCEHWMRMNKRMVSDEEKQLAFINLELKVNESLKVSRTDLKSCLKQIGNNLGYYVKLTGYDPYEIPKAAFTKCAKTHRMKIKKPKQVSIESDCIKTAMLIHMKGQRILTETAEQDAIRISKLYNEIQSHAAKKDGKIAQRELYSLIELNIVNPVINTVIETLSKMFDMSRCKMDGDKTKNGRKLGKLASLREILDESGLKDVEITRLTTVSDFTISEDINQEDDTFDWGDFPSEITEKY